MKTYEKVEVSGQLHAPAVIPPEKEPPVHFGLEVGWDPELVWTRWRGEKSPCPCRESKPGSPVRRL